jgi:hypothetical protein
MPADVPAEGRHPADVLVIRVDPRDPWPDLRSVAA